MDTFVFFLTLELGLNQSLPVVNHSPSVIISSNGNYATANGANWRIKFANR